MDMATSTQQQAADSGVPHGPSEVGPGKSKAGAARSCGGKRIAGSSSRRPWQSWGDMSDDMSDLEDDEVALPDATGPAPHGSPPPASSKDGARHDGGRQDSTSPGSNWTRSLLIQSFSGMSAPSSGSVLDRGSPASDESPTPLVQQSHSTTVGFTLGAVPESQAESNLANSRVLVPIDPDDGHRQGYAGLLTLSKSSKDGCGKVPTIEPVLSAECDDKVCTPLPCVPSPRYSLQSTRDNSD